MIRRQKYHLTDTHSQIKMRHTSLSGSTASPTIGKGQTTPRTAREGVERDVSSLNKKLHKNIWL